jgi:pilus assembly protein Flp/PilA
MKKWFGRFVREDAGQDLIEYAFLAVFIALAVTAAIQGIGTALNTQFTNGGVQVGQPANQIGRSQAGGS